jgi:hypothetical protein
MLAVAAVLGAFLYVAAVGGRIGTTMRVRSAADAAALAAATVKARSLNYESFVLLAQSILFPLSQVAHYISSAQLANEPDTVCAATLLIKGMETLGEACIQHVLSTAVDSRREDHRISDFLSSLSTIGNGLDAIGPLWAESVATQTATHAAYQSGRFAIDLVQVFPTPSAAAGCSTLGVVLTDPSTPNGVRARKACEAQAAWELAYVAMSMDLNNGPIDAWDWELATLGVTCASIPAGAKPLCDLLKNYPALGNMKSPSSDLKKIYSTATLQAFIKARDSYQARLAAGVPPGGPSAADLSNPQKSSSCAALNQIPQLSPSWQQYTRSVAMTMQSHPSDRYFFGALEALRRPPPTRSAPLGGPLGIACAEHYSLAAPGSESLFSMDFRARLIPCAFAVQANVDQILSCGGQSGPIGEQFQRELALGIQSEWRY